MRVELEPESPTTEGGIIDLTVFDSVSTEPLAERWIICNNRRSFLNEI